ncbi:OmpA family protein [Pedobacter gandavensis]|uniref:OmpA family protein n=1 Tax=Pedobacter gandavensis TaxID=2679963 RepID=UPI00247A80CC|nr:OmpA family protein [Pedobacter gandavensis]WGQ11294.1 OmpA family protein [Pedobacter gandavensis]
MAFDLNKNDGSVKDSDLKKSGSAKFDLTKGEGSNIAGGTSTSKNWIIGLVGILCIGTGFWYYSSHSAIEKQGGVTATAPESSGSTPTIVASSKEVSGGSVVEDTAQVMLKPTGKDKYLPLLSQKTGATFGQGSSSFKKIDHSLIKNLIAYLTENPGSSIHINGYASSDGTLAVNQMVSQARADAFKKYLTTKNIAERRIVAVGKGIENPIASNHTNAGRKKNRRVEISLP